MMLADMSNSFDEAVPFLVGPYCICVMFGNVSIM